MVEHHNNCTSQHFRTDECSCIDEYKQERDALGDQHLKRDLRELQLYQLIEKVEKERDALQHIIDINGLNGQEAMTRALGADNE